MIVVDFVEFKDLLVFFRCPLTPVHLRVEDIVEPLPALFSRAAPQLGGEVVPVAGTVFAYRFDQLQVLMFGPGAYR